MPCYEIRHMEKRLLLRMLAGIFTFQAVLFSAGFAACWLNGGLKVCPELGQRYENTFNVMITSTIALLTGTQLRR